MARCRVSAAPRVALLGAAYVLYVLLGALVFTALEAPRERDNKVALRERLAALGSEAGNGSCRSAELRDALVAAVKSLKKKKSAGPDGIPAEILKHGGYFLLRRLHLLIKSIWLSETIPQEWKDANILVIYKKKRGKVACGNSRESMQHNLKLVSSFYRSVDLQMNTQKTQHINILEAFHIRCLQRILGLTLKDKVPRTEILNNTKSSCIELVVEARIYGVMGADGTISNLTNWDYNSAIFFAGTVVTTIGYGNLSPATVGGKVFCIIFATFGIPLNVVVLNKVGQVILRGLDWIAEVLRKKGSIRLLTTMAFVGLGFMIFVLFPAVIFMAVEGWSYTESYYFSFVTLSTIGFGDYVVGSNPSVHYTPLYKTMVAMWIIFGLAWLSAVFNAITALLERVGEDLARRDRRDLGSEGGIAIVDPGHPSHGDTTGDHGQMGEMGKEIHQVTNAGGETGGGSPIPGVSTEKGAIKDPGPGGGTEKDDLKDPGPGGDKEKDDLKDPGPGGGSEKEDLKDSGPGRDTEKGDLNASGPGGGVEKGDHGPEGGMENGGSVGSDTPDKPNLAEAQTERDDI
ncbi:uncharacterized protein LOC144729844 [Lampetra planeri]